mgnify:CR=1 FL=1
MYEYFYILFIICIFTMSKNSTRGMPYDMILSDSADTNEIYADLRKRDFGRDNPYTKEFMNLLQKGYECKTKNKKIDFSVKKTCDDSFIINFHKLNAKYPVS